VIKAWLSRNKVTGEGGLMEAGRGMTRPTINVDLDSMRMAMSAMRIEMGEAVRSGIAAMNPGVFASMVIAYLYLAFAEEKAARPCEQSPLIDALDSRGLEVLRANPGLGPSESDHPAIQRLYARLLKTAPDGTSPRKGLLETGS